MGVEQNPVNMLFFLSCNKMENTRYNRIDFLSKLRDNGKQVDQRNMKKQKGLLLNERSS